MFVKLAVVSCALGIALAGYSGPLAGGTPAAQFPAGINPQSCPNYPNCADPLVAINQGPQARAAQPQYQPQQYQPQPQYQPQQYQPQQPAQQYSQPINQYNPVLPQQYQPAQAKYSPEVQQALNLGKYIGDGDYHGEGLAEALAPGYTQQAQRQAYQPQPYQAQPQPQPQLQARAYNPSVPAQIPAGVDASVCPNYPFCH